mmetsp:Transcript_21489/g.46708  ORF Transcript_21489/g.46708 Transcript_21489/m.46708 type:complete len:315 (-) Transcript_21489:338-1282(-)
MDFPKSDIGTSGLEDSMWDPESNQVGERHLSKFIVSIKPQDKTFPTLSRMALEVLASVPRLRTTSQNSWTRRSFRRGRLNRVSAKAFFRRSPSKAYGRLGSQVTRLHMDKNPFDPLNTVIPDANNEGETQQHRESPPDESTRSDEDDQSSSGVEDSPAVDPWDIGPDRPDEDSSDSDSDSDSEEEDALGLGSLYDGPRRTRKHSPPPSGDSDDEEVRRPICGYRTKEDDGRWVGCQAKMKAPATPYTPPPAPLTNTKKTSTSTSEARASDPNPVPNTEIATSSTRTEGAKRWCGCQAEMKAAPTPYPPPNISKS